MFAIIYLRNKPFLLPKLGMRAGSAPYVGYCTHGTEPVPLTSICSPQRDVLRRDFFFLWSVQMLAVFSYCRIMSAPAQKEEITIPPWVLHVTILSSVIQVHLQSKRTVLTDFD